MKSKGQPASASGADWYTEYLSGEHWERTRAAKLAAAGYRCERCGEWGRRALRPERTLGLHVHHLTYERVGNELPEDLEVLCVPCHEEAHGTHVDEHRRQQARDDLSLRIAGMLIPHGGMEDVQREITAWDRVADHG